MTKPKTVERLTRADIGGAEDGTPGAGQVRDHQSDKSARAVEEAWLLKSTMEWAREDHGPVKAFRWHIWDLCSLGHPPSRVVPKSK
jgi:hypothetical protein